MGKIIYTIGKSICIFDEETGEELYKLIYVKDYDIRKFIQYNDIYIIVVYVFGDIVIWENDNIYKIFETNKYVENIVLSCDNNYLIYSYYVWTNTNYVINFNLINLENNIDILFYSKDINSSYTDLYINNNKLYVNMLVGEDCYLNIINIPDGNLCGEFTFKKSKLYFLNKNYIGICYLKNNIKLYDYYLDKILFEFNTNYKTPITIINDNILLTKYYGSVVFLNFKGEEINKIEIVPLSFLTIDINMSEDKMLVVYYNYSKLINILTKEIKTHITKKDIGMTLTNGKFGDTDILQLW